jgi:4'-phosphopantetheinyl transferase
VLQVAARPHRPSARAPDTRAARSLDAWRLAVEVVREVAAVEASPSPVRRCRTCGAAGHGKPELPAALAAGLHVSVSTAPGLVAVAVCDEGPVGVDVESVAAVAAAPVADVLLHPREPVPVTPRDLARTWVRKEALLKATGHGLVVAPGELVLTGPHEAPALLRAPPELNVGAVDGVRILDLHDAGLLDVGRDHVGAVAVLPR